MTPPASALTIWTARLAFLLYGGAVVAWISRRHPAAARWLWIAGWAVFLVHVAAAFHFEHHWSHEAAYEETARRTAELMGERARSGSGLYLNYVFAALWTLDAVWLWRDAASYARRPGWIGAALHGFFAFLFVNATIVFGTAGARWMGWLVFGAIGWAWIRRRFRAGLP